jgi:hypothetical protein
MGVAMRRLPLLIVLLPVLALVPAANARKDANTAGRTVSFQVMSFVRIAKPYDFPPKGKENKGDYIEFKSVLATIGPLFGKPNKNMPVGWDKGTLVYLNAVDARLRGTATFLGQGTIIYRGKMKSLSRGRSSVPIIGGAGKFRGAKGVLIIGAGELKALNTFRFKLPGALTA